MQQAEINLREYAMKLGPSHCALRFKHLAEASGLDDLDEIRNVVENLCKGDAPAFRKDAVAYFDDVAYVLEGEDLEFFLEEGAVVDPQSGEVLVAGTFDWCWEYAVI